MELENIKGIGINTISNLKALGINDVDDLINYYPFRYEVIEKSNFQTLQDGDKIVIDGIAENVPSVFHFNRKLNKMTFRLNTGTNLLNITIFNRAYLKQSIKVGSELTVIGKYDLKHHAITASNIKMGLLKNTTIEPVYHSSYKLNSKKINKIINKALENFEVLDYVPESLNQK